MNHRGGHWGASLPAGAQCLSSPDSKVFGIKGVIVMAQPQGTINLSLPETKRSGPGEHLSNMWEVPSFPPQH